MTPDPKDNDALDTPAEMDDQATSEAYDAEEERKNREAFLTKAGCTPEEYLGRWEAGEIDKTNPTSADLYRDALGMVAP